MAGKSYKIALIPGDGIGTEVVPEGVRVLEAAARKFGFSLKCQSFDWSCEVFKKTGKMMPDDGLDHARLDSLSARASEAPEPFTDDGEPDDDGL